MIDRLSSLVGFTMRVTERGGTKLGSLLSNKNLWAAECGRKDCRVCVQSGDKREDCVRRNILNESECVECTTGSGSDSLEMSDSKAFLYVGESAHSLYERSSEHWKAAEMKTDESHMHQHIVESHEVGSRPTLKF